MNLRTGGLMALFGILTGLGMAALTFAVRTTTPTLPPNISEDAGCPLPEAEDDQLRVLVFSKTAGFRHESIGAGVEALTGLAETRQWEVTASEDAGLFSDDSLADFDVVVFLNTTGDILDSEQEAAFERFIRAGGGFVGIHSATDTEYDWEWYGGLVGAYFANHPPGTTSAEIHVEDPEHPSAVTLPEIWERTDEWYNFRENPRDQVGVILTLNESTYSGGTMGEDHPISWAHEYDGGRAFYTAMGHTSESFREPLFLEHLTGAIEWAGGRCPEPESNVE
jgi:type 1 glutamine amidotransferase